MQAEPDDNYLLSTDFSRGVRAMQGTGLVYDVLIYERHLPQTIEFVDQHPRQVFVLDHVAKPRIREGVMEPWATHIRTLAQRENVWCKVSGMVTEADWRTWTLDSLRPYLDVVVEEASRQQGLWLDRTGRCALLRADTHNGLAFSENILPGSAKRSGMQCLVIRHGMCIGWADGTYCDRKGSE